MGIARLLHYHHNFSDHASEDGIIHGFLALLVFNIVAVIVASLFIVLEVCCESRLDLQLCNKNIYLSVEHDTACSSW